MIALVLLYIPLILAAPLPRNNPHTLQLRDVAELNTRASVMDGPISSKRNDIINWQNVSLPIIHSVESLAHAAHDHFSNRQVGEVEERSFRASSSNNPKVDHPFDTTLIDTGLIVDRDLSTPASNGPATGNHMVVPGFMLTDEAASDIDRAMGGVRV